LIAQLKNLVMLNVSGNSSIVNSTLSTNQYQLFRAKMNGCLQIVNKLTNQKNKVINMAHKTPISPRNT
jgi:hypothetical protein